MAVHHVKSWPEFFQPILAGTRRHELRKNDRDYQINDLLILHEWIPGSGSYTGRTAEAVITSMTSAEFPCAVSENGLTEGYCIFTVKITGHAEQPVTSLL